MKLAVVPVNDHTTGILKYGSDRRADIEYKVSQCKLTKEQFNLMVDAYRKAEDECFSSSQCLYEALYSVGIEVE